MPILKFQLRSRRLILDATPSREEWELVFDAVSQPVKEGQSFKILSRGKQYDGYGVAGTVYIRPRTTQPELASPEQKVGHFGSVVVIHPPEDWGETSPSFEAQFFLSADSFRRLIETDLPRSVIELWVTTAMKENGLIYGDNPDGKELEWWSERANTAAVESISIRFVEP